MSKRRDNWCRATSRGSDIGWKVPCNVETESPEDLSCYNVTPLHIPKEVVCVISEREGHSKWGRYECFDVTRLRVFPLKENAI